MSTELGILNKVMDKNRSINFFYNWPITSALVKNKYMVTKFLNSDSALKYVN